MEKRNLLEGKKVLIVDDEPDVLESLEELLSDCKVTSADHFEAAKDLLESERFDIAILDIMGVNGYELLDIANKRGVIPVMLTAHALTPQDAAKSFRSGAASYLPKEEMLNLETFLNDILEAKEKGKSFWWRWFDRLGDYYDRKFGPDWKEADKDIWDMIKYGA
ncbi:Response regulator receiver domain protein [uncultured Desulfatiglans sp.]|nr:Response regulator receiver domain protein [uncultured Desulfatiglans sp.]